MAGFFSRFGRAARMAAKAIATSRNIHNYQLQGKVITCPHCQSEEFDEGSALLNTAGMTFINLDWANRSASILACRRCGQVQWFLQKPEKKEDTSTSTKTS